MWQLLCVTFSTSRKAVRPSRRSDEHIPASKPASGRPGGGGVPKKPSVPSARGAKVIESRGRGAPGQKKGVAPGNARRSAPGREKVWCVCY